MNKYRTHTCGELNIKDKNKKIKVLDFGTGSACIAISIAKEYPNSKIIALDKSKKRLK